jgi:hypothetical protein
VRIRHQHFKPVAEPLPPDPPDLFEIIQDAVDAQVRVIPGGGGGMTFGFQSDFDPPAQPVDTSLEAASRIRGVAARRRMAILLWLRTQDNATEREISTALGLNSSGTRPRLRELEGNAPWAKGKLPRLIERLTLKRAGMRCYRALTPKE